MAVTPLERIPIEVPWGLILTTVGWLLIVILIPAILMRGQIRKIDPNAVLRDNGTP